MNEIQNIQHAVVMKNGIVLFISAEKAHTLSDHLTSQTAHSFIELTDIHQTINSADISGVYSPEQYQEYLRVQAGEYQCAYRHWHKKRESCECSAELFREQRRRKQKEENEIRPLTPEERKQQQEVIAKINRERPLLAASKSVRGIKRSALVEYEKKHGRPYVVSSGTTIIEDTN